MPDAQTGKAIKISSPVEELDSGATLPKHVAIIMDGNGRWAAARHLPRRLGHRQGVETVRNIVRAAGELGIQYLTLYSFSSENWKRPVDEVNDLMGLLQEFVRRHLKELDGNGVKVRIIGERHGLSPEIIEIIENAERQTKDNTRLQLIIAFNYGGRNEILEAAKRFAREAVEGNVDPDTCSHHNFEKHLDTFGVPDPDLIIRTSGEQRLSNFLLWQAAYSELFFCEKLWPDFKKEDLENAVTQFASRERRFGAR